MWQNLRLETFASLLESIVIFKIAFDSFFFPLYGYRFGFMFAPFYSPKSTQVSSIPKTSHTRFFSLLLPLPYFSNSEIVGFFTPQARARCVCVIPSEFNLSLTSWIHFWCCWVIFSPFFFKILTKKLANFLTSINKFIKIKT